MNLLFDDLRYALRLYRRTPLQSLSAVFVIAVAVAFSTAFFRLYENLALQMPQGFEEPARLVGVGLSGAGSLDLRLPGRLRQAIAERSGTLETVAGVMYVDGQLVIAGEAVPAIAGVVSSDFFDGLGVVMHIGSRLRTADSLAGAPPAVLDYWFWQRHFRGDSSALGSQVEIDGAPFTVVGVAHPDFRGAHRGRGADAWFPLESFAASVWNANPGVIGERLRMVSAARLTDRANLHAVANELLALTEELRAEFRDDLLGLRVIPLENLAPDPAAHAYAVRQVQLLVAAAILLSLVAAANLGLFLLGQLPRRQREMGIRASVGATQGRLVRQLLTESTAIVVVGVVLGFIGHVWLTGILRDLSFLAGVDWVDVRLIDGPAVSFLAALTLVIAAAVGVAPALNLARHSLTESTRRLARGIAMSQRLVVGLQITIAALAFAVAVLFADNLIRISVADPGYTAEQVSVIQLSRADGDLPDDPATVTSFRRAVAERLTSSSGIDAVGFGDVVPAFLAPDTYAVEIVGGIDSELPSQVARVDHNWFEALRMRRIVGGLPAFDDHDAVVVTKRFAELAWGRLDVIGERIRAPAEYSPAGGASEGLLSFRVAAVIDDVNLAEPAGLATPVVFVNRPVPRDIANFVLVRGSVSRRDVQLMLTELLDQLAPGLEVVQILSLEDALASLSAPERVRTALSGVAAGLTVLMSVFGLIGALRLMVRSSRFEYALRSALGADPTALRNRALSRGCLFALPGLIVGLMVSSVTLELIRGWFDLFDVNVLLAIAICFGFLGPLIVGCVWFSAIQAANVEPGPLLSSE